VKTVRKFLLQVTDVLEVEMPQGARLLHLGIARARPCVWALVEESSPPSLRRFRLTATGEPIPDLLPGWTYVGSVVLGANDCHLWDLGEVGSPPPPPA
jgi:hypothetical protein